MGDRILPLSSKLGFGVGQVAEGIKTSAFNTFVLFYYNQILGVSASLTAVALAIAIVIDAITDPVVGYWSDHTRSRWGRRHPFMVGSAVPFGLSLLLLFNPPAGMSDAFYGVWLTGAAVLLRLFLTLYHVPHLALGAEMARDYTDRTRVFSYSTLFGALGGWGFWFVCLSFFFRSSADYGHGMYNPHGYLSMSVLGAFAIMASISLCCWGTWKEIPGLKPVPQTPRPRSLARAIFAEMWSVFRNRSYLVLFFGLVFGTLVVAIEAVFNTYMGVHFWELPTEQLRWIGVAVFCGLPVSFVLAPVLTRLLDKKRALITTAALAIVNGNVLIVLRLFTDVLPPNGDPVVFWAIIGTSFIGAATAPVILITINSMFADVADEQELLTGERQEGVIYAARAFALKATGALGAIIGGVGLDLIHFPKAAEPGAVPDEVIFNLGLVAGPVTSLFTFVGLLLFLGYRLDRTRVEEIRGRLA